ncbi:metallopeptidase [Patescibacteria group bacterium]|nr:metallopeptidase [Patescibacteria group bacterium]MBU2036061.1 metallopeptidase [Patescibacteria group bacterium]
MWFSDFNVQKNVIEFLEKLNFPNFDNSRIFCLRSENANTRAIARIYGLSRIWQQVLKQKPAYIIEVISEKFDRLSENEKNKVLLHEIAHIPKNFSGSLVPHIRKGKRSFYLRLKRLIENTNKA